MTERDTARTSTLVILGASGDLTSRLLLPGLGRLLGTGRIRDLTLVGVGRDDWDEPRWRERIAQSFAQACSQAEPDGQSALETVVQRATYYGLDVTEEGALARLFHSLPAPIAVYFALPPAVSQQAITLLRPQDVPAGTRLVLEKPFGSSEQSARALNKTLVNLVPEEHIYRVDHFLGLSTVINILGLRFANRLLEPLWNARHIEKVEIIFDEELTLENRAGYYDTAGALRDMIQSHLLQVMALIAMEPPASIGERDIREGIASVLRASDADPQLSRRARYTAGTIGDREAPDYVAEPGVDPSHCTETLAQVQVAINNWRWAGVPFTLRSGKALGRSRKEAVITYRAVPHLPRGFSGVDEPTRLHIGFDPDVLQIELDVNGSGDIFTLQRTILQTQLAEDSLLPYGEVLRSVLEGDARLSVRADVAEQCWRIVEPTVRAWEKVGAAGLEDYPAGTAGPECWETNFS